MASSDERNDRRPRAARPSDKPWVAAGRGVGARTSRGPKPAAGGEWLWGWHAVEAALRNPARVEISELLVTEERSRAVHALRPGLRAEAADNAAIARRLPAGAVHQGVALQTPELEGATLEELAQPASGLLLLLDGVTDPQNVGAIFRSAAAFGARGVILQERRAPPMTGALAKAAAGAIERVPCARVVNLSRALDTLADAGWRAVGLDGEAQTPLDGAFDGSPTVLVLGSEGEGLRRLVSEHCETLAKIPMPGGFESLNVATAAAIALYEASRTVKMRAPGEHG